MVARWKVWRTTYPLRAFGAEAAVFAPLLVVIANIHVLVAALCGVTWFCFLAVMNWARRR